MELHIARSALEDLQAIQAYYAEQDVPHIGDEYVAAILKHSEILEGHPDAGRIVPEFSMDHIRELIHPPFRVVYLRREADIVLLRIWRSERKLELPETKYNE